MTVHCPPIAKILYWRKIEIRQFGNHIGNDIGLVSASAMHVSFNVTYQSDAVTTDCYLNASNLPCSYKHGK